MNKQKNNKKEIPEFPNTISTQLYRREIQRIEELGEKLGYKKARVLRALVMIGLEEIGELGELQARQLLARSGTLVLPTSSS